MENIYEQLIRHEGEVIVNGRHMPYNDSKGHLTIGYGHNLENGIPQIIADMLLRYSVAVAIKECQDNFDFYLALNPERQDVLVNMCFNMGITRLLSFEKMIAALEAEDYDTAAEELLDSKYAREDVGESRSSELAEQMRTGERQ